MADYADNVDAEFVIDDVEAIVKQALQATLSEVQYDPEKVASWSNSVIDSCLKGLQSLTRPFKYVVTCIMMQKNGAGMHTAAAAYWDKKDDVCRVPWENATIHCIVTVFGLALAPVPQTDV